jgi:hypothetical protein
MAIIGPADLPVVLKVDSNPLKSYCMSQLGHPTTAVELHETQWEIILRTVGDWIAGYFPREQRLAVFYTVPLQPLYPMPEDAYWVQEVAWNPVSTRIDDVFGSESYLFNVGNISGSPNMLLDYHLIQAYRKTSAKILGTEGHWEVLNEGGEGPTNQKIRLYPTPKGVFPVLVLYYPVVTHFRSPQAKKVCYDMTLGEMMCVLGRSRRKLANVPSATGGTLGWDGGDLVSEGTALKELAFKQAINLGEPLPIIFI